METLEDFLKRITAEAERTRPDRRKELIRKHSYSTTNIAKDIDMESEVIEVYNKEIFSFVDFILNCKLKVAKPKVQRTKCDWSRKSFKHRNRYVSPTVTLVHGTKKIVIIDPDHFSSRLNDIPWFLYNYMSKISVGDYYRRLAAGMASSFYHKVEPKWTEIKSESEKIWNDTERDLDKIVTEHLGVHSDKERRAFRSKLITLFSNTKKLVDASPEAVLEIFSLGPTEIDALRAFSSRNKADVGMVDVEDVIDAQNEARVKHVMES